MKGVELRTPMPEDIEEMWREESDPVRGRLWRLGGMSVSLDEFRQLVWANAMSQYLVIEPQSSRILGVVQVYDYNAWDGHCKVGVCSYHSNGAGVMLGLVLALDRVFEATAVRRIYLEVPEDNLDKMHRILSRMCVLEGRIREHST